VLALVLQRVSWQNSVLTGRPLGYPQIYTTLVWTADNVQSWTACIGTSWGFFWLHYSLPHLSPHHVQVGHFCTYIVTFLSVLMSSNWISIFSEIALTFFNLPLFLPHIFCSDYWSLIFHATDKNSACSKHATTSSSWVSPPHGTTLVWIQWSTFHFTFSLPLDKFLIDNVQNLCLGYKFCFNLMAATCW